jgi:hypothetical protein
MVDLLVDLCGAIPRQQFCDAAGGMLGDALEDMT